MAATNRNTFDEPNDDRALHEYIYSYIDRAKAIKQVSLLQSVVLSSQLKDMLGSLGSSPGTVRLVYNQRDPFFVSKTVRSIYILCCAHNKLKLT